MPRQRDNMMQTDFSADEARRIALAAQGFDRGRSSGRVGLADLRRVIHQLGLVQIDYFNVLAPRSTRFFSRVSDRLRCRSWTTWSTGGESLPSTGRTRHRSFRLKPGRSAPSNGHAPGAPVRL